MSSVIASAGLVAENGGQLDDLMRLRHGLARLLNPPITFPSLQPCEEESRARDGDPQVISSIYSALHDGLDSSSLATFGTPQPANDLTAS